MDNLELKCIMFFLNVCKNQREKLYDDLINESPDLWHGLLNDNNTALHDLYSGKYQISWINEHWSEIAKWKDSDKLSENDKRFIVRYFGDNFISFVKELKYFNEDGIDAFFEYRYDMARSFDELIAANISVEKLLEHMNLKAIKASRNFEKRIEKLKLRESEGN